MLGADAHASDMTTMAVLVASTILSIQGTTTSMLRNFNSLWANAGSRRMSRRKLTYPLMRTAMVKGEHA